MNPEINKELLDKINEEAERWLPVVGFEGLYEVSNWGNVRSVKLGEILKQFIANQGYCMVNLRKNKKRKYASVARMVAAAFISNPENLPVINHRDLNKTNNYYKNIEWCTQQYNTIHAHQNRHISRKGVFTEKHLAAMKKHFNNPVYAYDPITKELLHYESNKACAKEFGVNRSTISSTISIKCKLRKRYRLFHESGWQQFKLENNL